MVPMTFYLYCLLILLPVTWARSRSRRRQFYAHEQISGVGGEEVELECDLIAAALDTDPSKLGLVSKVEWVKNGAIVASFSKGEFSAEWWVSGIRLQLDRYNYKLLIRDVQSSDEGTYTCLPQFQVDDSSLWKARPLEAPQRIQLIVIGPPSRPGRAIVQSFTSRSVTISWEPSRVHMDAPTLHHYILIHKGIEPNESTHARVVIDGNATSWVVTNLHPYTQYVFQVIAENRAGRSIAGPVSYPIRTKGEAPSVSPTIVSVYNTSNTSLMVTYKSPPNETLYGPLVGYRIMTHRLSSGVRKELYLRDPTVTSYELTNLSVYHKYMISLEADNNFGYSPAATVVVQTDEGVPTSPPIITNVQVVDSESVQLTWTPPKYLNGRLVGYYIRYQSAGSTAINSAKIVHTYSQNHIIPIMRHKIIGLLAYTEYRFWVTAATSKGQGPNSEKSIVLTDTAGPSAPRISNITLEAENLIKLQWLKPVTFYNKIDLYMLKMSIVLRDGTESLSQIYNTTDQHIFWQLSLYNSEPERVYVVRIAAMTRSIVHPHIIKIGPESEKQAFIIKLHHDPHDSVQVTLHTSACTIDGSTLSVHKTIGSVICDTSLKSDPGGTHTNLGSRVTLIALSIMLLIATLAFLCVFICMIWRRKRRKYSGYESPTYIQCTSLNFDPFDEVDCPSIEVSAFADHVARISADQGAELSAEFQAIDAEALADEQEHRLTSENSSMPCNKPKNRYVNIIAYDQTRVILRPMKGLLGSDYINANFVDGYHKKRAYIATQGPLEHTFCDFWRMVWEQKTQVIVMITNVVEKGRKKCDQYWPSDGCETYGDHYQIKMISEFSSAFYTTRMLSLKNVKSKTRCQERVIYHYQYTNWPDHGVPPDCLPVLSFIRKSSVVSDKQGSGPMVVHCSAGVGRSGTYMLLDSMIRQLKDRKCLNIKGYLKHIRKQRNFLVQTEEQYMFCYEALLEYILYGDTEICVTDLPAFITEGLEFLDQNAAKTVLESQFQHVTNENAHQVKEEAFKPVNKIKNRSQFLVTTDEHRVALSTQAGIDGSDYINATYLPGFNHVQEFIVTQSPLSGTLTDFWRMVWEQNCQTIVVLVDGMDGKPLWPSVNSIGWRYDHFYMYTTEEASGRDWSCTDLLLQSSSDEFQLPCRLLHCPHWTNKSYMGIWDVIRAVQDWRMKYQNGPIVVVDGPGGTDAAKFCALASLSNQMEQECAVDLFLLTRLYHVRRPGVWKAQADLMYLYNCLGHLLENTDSDSESASLVDIHRPGDNVIQSRGSRQSRLDIRPIINSKELFEASIPPITSHMSTGAQARPNSIHVEHLCNGAAGSGKQINHNNNNIMNRSLVYPAISDVVNGSTCRSDNTL